MRCETACARTLSAISDSSLPVADEDSPPLSVALAWEISEWVARELATADESGGVLLCNAQLQLVLRGFLSGIASGDATR